MVAKDLLQVREFINRHDLKRADSVVSKLLRSELSSAWKPSVMICKAEVRLLLNRADDSIALIHELLNLFSHDDFDKVLAQEILADAYLMRYEDAQAGFANRQDLAMAEAIYGELLEQDIQYRNAGWVHYQCGRIFLARGEIQEAWQSFMKAIFSASRLKILTAYCFERLGFIAYYEHRDYHQSSVLLDKALQTYPNDAKPDWLARLYLMRARVIRHLSVNDAEASALEALKIARRLGSQGLYVDGGLIGEVLFTLAELLMESSRQKDIIGYLQDFFQTQRAPLGVDVTWSRAYEMLGDAYLQLKDYDGAIKAYAHALQFNPDHPWLESLYLRVCNAKMGLMDYEGILETLERFIEQTNADIQPISDYRIYLLQADAYKALGQFSKARESVMNALEIARIDLVENIKEQYLS